MARRAAEANPEDPDIRNFIARTLLTSYPNKPEAIDEALTQIGECLRLRPDDPAPLWGFTNDFFETPKTPAAVERLSALMRPVSPIAPMPISFWAWSPTRGDRTPGSRLPNTRLP